MLDAQVRAKCFEVGIINLPPVVEHKGISHVELAHYVPSNEVSYFLLGDRC